MVLYYISPPLHTDYEYPARIALRLLPSPILLSKLPYPPEAVGDGGL